jgi:hypothetical protein
MIANSKTLSGLTEAQQWANAMVMREMRTPGDLLNAMHRLEARYGIPWRTFFNLRYRAPADVLVGVYRQLKLAYDAECERQERLLAHERHVAQTKLAAVEALVGASPDTNIAEGI